MGKVYVLVDIFRGFDKFFAYLDSIPYVKERHQTLSVEAYPCNTSVIDYEVILKIESEKLEGIRHTIQKIKTYDGVKDIRVLTVV